MNSDNRNDSLTENWQAVVPIYLCFISDSVIEIFLPHKLYTNSNLAHNNMKRNQELSPSDFP